LADERGDVNRRFLRSKRVVHRPSAPLIWLFALLLLAPTLAACGSIQQKLGDLQAGSGGTLRLSGGSPDTLDPALAQDVTSWGYLLEVFSGLVRLDDQLKVQPDLAKSWTVSDDGRTYTFSLRTDAHFQDGRPLTAADFKYSLERALDPKTKSPVAQLYLGDIVGATERLQGRATDVSGIVVVDAYTLRLTIDARKSYFLSKLTYPTAFALDQHNVDSGADWSQKPNGTGPFKLQSWDPQVGLTLVRNPGYYADRPTLDEVDYYFGTQPPIAIYQQNKLDVAAIGVGDIPRVTDPTGPFARDVQVVPLLSVQYLGFNVQQKPFDDPKVRLAFAYATNKQALLNGLFRGAGDVAPGVMPPGLPGYAASFAGVPFDPQQARALLADSSYHSVANLPPITLSVPSGAGDLALGFARMYHDNLGVDVSVVVLANTFYPDLQAHRLQMFYLGWVADYPDPQDFLDILFRGGSDANYTAYSSSEVTQILDQANVETDPSRRFDLYQTAERRIVQDAPLIPLYHDRQYFLVKPTVKGLKITPMGIVTFAGVRIQG
jgi:oligopeptide transport system substrate-binding protein